MSKVKDFETELDSIEENSETSIQELRDYLRAKTESFEINVSHFNYNLSNIINTSITTYEAINNEKTRDECVKLISKCMKLFKFIDEE